MAVCSLSDFQVAWSGASFCWTSWGQRVGMAASVRAQESQLPPSATEQKCQRPGQGCSRRGAGGGTGSVAPSPVQGPGPAPGFAASCSAIPSACHAGVYRAAGSRATREGATRALDLGTRSEVSEDEPLGGRQAPSD